jgi:excinuclease ABC subunit B
MPDFEVVSPFQPSGDQPTAIASLVEGVTRGDTYQTLQGITGSGKTATIAWMIEQAQRPVLIIEPNKSLAAQLSSELRDLFPKNRVEFFVSYYDYYQPEAYLPTTDTYIEKDSSINDEIDRLRHATTSSLLMRRDVIVVASVSCIYGLGSPEEYRDRILALTTGEQYDQRDILRRLVDLQYARNDVNLVRGTFRARGDTVEIHPAYEEQALRIEMFGDTIERIVPFDVMTGEMGDELDDIAVYAATHYVTGDEIIQRAVGTIEIELRERLQEFEQQGKLLEAQRLRVRTEHDLEMLAETGVCSGVENYSRHLDGRAPGETPYTLLDFFPKDYLVVIDESHVAVPQLHGQHAGDRSRKDMLVEHGFRLPSARDNRPLRFDEFIERVPQCVFVSATPGPFEKEHSTQMVEQVIRPTGLVDPEVTIMPTKGQVDDLLARITTTVAAGARVLVTTLTKKMAEDLTDYLADARVRVQYLHSDIDTITRIEILRELRLGTIDVLVGINLLREGLDLPEVSLVAVLDADKEGFLRSQTSLIQTAGRAARHQNGLVILYADKITDSIKELLRISKERREKQLAYNTEHGITPRSVIRAVQESLGNLLKGRQIAALAGGEGGADMDVTTVLQELEDEMLAASAAMQYEKAALLRDQIMELKQQSGIAKIEPKKPASYPKTRGKKAAKKI